MKIKCSALLFQCTSSLLSKRKNLPFQCLRLQSHHHFSSWHIVGAVCLQRKPVITSPLTPLEQRYFQYLQKIELEQSILSEHEKRHYEDIKKADKLKRGELDDTESISQQTAQDFEDTSLEEFNKFTPNSRITEADEKNDKKSLHRKLDSTLVLVTNQKLGNDPRWILPQAVHQDGETLRQTAERALHEICSSPLKVQFMGNAPVGYYKYKYPKIIRGNGVCGAKVFFFKAQLLDKKLQYMDLKKREDIIDHMWVTHKELEDTLTPVYGKAVQSFLYPDSLVVDDEEIYQMPAEDDQPVIKSSASN